MWLMGQRIGQRGRPPREPWEFATTKVCRVCGESKPLTNYSRRTWKSGNGGYQGACQQCVYAKRLRHWAANPDIRERDRQAINASHKRVRSTLDGWCRYMACSLRKRAKATGLPCDITEHDIRSAFPADGRCPVLGTELIFGPHGSRGKRTNASVDRLRPDLGYIRGNIAVVSMRANSIKQDATSVEILAVGAWVRRMEEQTAHDTPLSRSAC